MTTRLQILHYFRLAWQSPARRPSGGGAGTSQTPEGGPARLRICWVIITSWPSAPGHVRCLLLPWGSTANPESTWVFMLSEYRASRARFHAAMSPPASWQDLKASRACDLVIIPLREIYCGSFPPTAPCQNGDGRRKSGKEDREEVRI